MNVVNILSFDKRLAAKENTRFTCPLPNKILLVGDGELYPRDWYWHLDVPSEGRKQALNYTLCVQKLIKEGKERGDEYVILMEDDQIPNVRYDKNTFAERVERTSHIIMDRFPDWDMLYLGGNIQNGFNKVVGEFESPEESILFPLLFKVVKSDYILDMGFTLFSQKVYDTILAIEPSNECTLDGVIASKQKGNEIKAYAVVPNLFTSLPNFSWNEGRVVNRSENHIL